MAHARAHRELRPRGRPRLGRLQLDAGGSAQHGAKARASRELVRALSGPPRGSRGFRRRARPRRVHDALGPRCHRAGRRPRRGRDERRRRHRRRARSSRRFRPSPVGVTLRLWTIPPARIPTAPAARPPRLAARATCHALGLPHVTLDLREDFRRAVVAPFVGGYARGETPNPCVRCNGSFRFASCSPSPAASAPPLATGHYARLVGTAAASSSPARPSRPRTSPTCSPPRPALLERSGSPSESRARTRRARRPRRRACRRRSAREPGGVFPRRRRLPRLPRAARAPGARRRRRRRGRARARAHDGFWRFTAGQRRGLGVASGEPLTPLGADARTNTSSSVPAARSPAPAWVRAPAAFTSRRAGRGEAPLPFARAPARVAAALAVSRSPSTTRP